MLVDVHAHFYHQRTPRADWRERNESRLSAGARIGIRSEEHTSELQSLRHLVCRLLLEKKNRRETVRTHRRYRRDAHVSVGNLADIRARVVSHGRYSLSESLLKAHLRRIVQYPSIIVYC